MLFRLLPKRWAPDFHLILVWWLSVRKTLIDTLGKLSLQGQSKKKEEPNKSLQSAEKQHETILNFLYMHESFTVELFYILCLL